MRVDGKRGSDVDVNSIVDAVDTSDHEVVTSGAGAGTGSLPVSAPVKPSRLFVGFLLCLCFAQNYGIDTDF